MVQSHLEVMFHRSYPGRCSSVEHGVINKRRRGIGITLDKRPNNNINKSWPRHVHGDAIATVSIIIYLLMKDKCHFLFKLRFCVVIDFWYLIGKINFL